MLGNIVGVSEGSTGESSSAFMQIMQIGSSIANKIKDKYEGKVVEVVKRFYNCKNDGKETDTIAGVLVGVAENYFIVRTKSGENKYIRLVGLSSAVSQVSDEEHRIFYRNNGVLEPESFSSGAKVDRGYLKKSRELSL